MGVRPTSQALKHAGIMHARRNPKFVAHVLLLLRAAILSRLMSDHLFHDLLDRIAASLGHGKRFEYEFRVVRVKGLGF